MVLETDRLLLPWRVAEAVVLRELSTNAIHGCRRTAASTRMATPARGARGGDPHQPAGDGRLLAVERKAAGDVIGYCGLIDSGRGSEGEPELAFELLRRTWGHGYATEASWAVLDWARPSGCHRLWATVWDRNTASRRVLAKVGFTETDRKEVDPVHGTTLFATRRLRRE